ERRHRSAGLAGVGSGAGRQHGCAQTDRAVVVSDAGRSPERSRTLGCRGARRLRHETGARAPRAEVLPAARDDGLAHGHGLKIATTSITACVRGAYTTAAP